MPRIRSIKPSFFRHEELQDLETKHPGQHIMLTFAGLWTLCDSKGVFEYKPRLIKLDILPFLEYNLPKTLEILSENGFIFRYNIEKSEYGFIKTFTEHQRITGKEATDGIKHPQPVLGNSGETAGKHPNAQEMEMSIGNGNDLLLSEKDFQTPPKTPRNVWIETFDKRKDVFKKSLFHYTKYRNNPTGLYDPNLVEEFFEYWNEPNISRSKMRWESEKTWDLSKRLKRWMSNNFGKNKINDRVVLIPSQEINHDERP